MSLEKAILLSMITASYKDKIIDEITYQNMIQNNKERDDIWKKKLLL